MTLYEPPLPRPHRSAVRFGAWVAHALADGGADLSRLRALPPEFRADALILLGADLADALVGYAAGQVGPGAVREAALSVAVMAGELWLASVPGLLAAEEE